jgi:hypothetical protein
LARVEQQLQNDGLLIVSTNEQATLIPSHLALDVLEVLSSKASLEDDMASLAELEVWGWLKPEQWARIVRTHRTNAEFSRRANLLIDSYRGGREEFHSPQNEHPRSTFASSKAMWYGTTVAPMMLAVIAIGSLLAGPPSSGCWSESSDVIEDRKLVVRNVVLLALLSGFDLALTLFAQRTGSLFELNPLGSHLMADPVALIAFKLSTLTIVCIILLSLRRYRGAQIASWWTCLICTVLTFRWVTFNSLFIT